MIPVKLELKNFLSYGDPIQTVDFQNYSLICLSGKNGNGKSALLDAITWVLWGNARKISGTIKADAGLMRLGQTQMMVSLEFISNGNRYRVRREFAKTYGKPYAALDLALFDETAKTFISLTEKTIRQTQVKIEKTVGIDFDTFINSAFLRQGQSNEFSTKSPKERKQILSTILGLSRYDLLQRLALDKGRVYSDERKILLKMHELELQELEQEKEKKKEHSLKIKELEDTDKTILSLEAIVNAREAEQKKYLDKKQQHALLENDKKNNEAVQKEKQKTLLLNAFEWKKIYYQSLQVDDPRVLEVIYKELLMKEKGFREVQQESLRIKELLLNKNNDEQKLVFKLNREYEKKINEHRFVVEKSELSFKQVLDQMQQKEKACDEIKIKQTKMSKVLKEIINEIAGFALFSKAFEREKKQFEKRHAFYQGFIQRGNLLQQLLKETEQKRFVLHDHENPSCPLCEQLLSVRRKQFLAKTIGEQELFLQHRLNKTRIIISKLKELLLDQHKHISKLELQNERFTQLQANKENIEKQQKELSSEYAKSTAAFEVYRAQKKQIEKIVFKQKEDLKKIEQDQKNVVGKDEGICKIQEELKILERQQKQGVYKKLDHEVVLKKLHKIEKQLKALEELKIQQAQQLSRRSQIHELCITLKNLKSISEEIEKKICRLAFDSHIEKVLIKDIVDSRQEQQALSKKRDRLLQIKAQLDNVLKRFESLRKERNLRETKIKDMDVQIRDYQTLAAMFGKDGIQALLIDQAIPEIESEANILLSRLTDNKSQIFIESLRDLKRGGVKESLDIHISDAVGVRPYEMFSGGEAFRIDFVLRIAISKLLARRAGTALQTLIIDEGFGSQDEEGLQRLMDSLYVIQKDFAKIIVVSHLPVFKDNFPVHFIVNKDSMGSFVTVEERG